MKKQRVLAIANLRARANRAYMAYVLARYSEDQKMDESALAAFLSCSPETLLRIGVCLRPQEQTFAAGIREIADYVGADAERLALLVRKVEVQESLENHQHTEQSFLMAARDRDNGES